MGRFSKLLEEKGKDITIGDETFHIKALPGSYFGKLGETTPEKQAEVMMDMVTASLQQSDETITRDEVEELPMKYLKRLIEVVSEVNELNAE